MALINEEKIDHAHISHHEAQVEIKYLLSVNQAEEEERIFSLSHCHKKNLSVLFLFLFQTGAQNDSHVKFVLRDVHGFNGICSDCSRKDVTEKAEHGHELVGLGDLAGVLPAVVPWCALEWVWQS